MIEAKKKKAKLVPTPIYNKKKAKKKKEKLDDTYLSVGDHLEVLRRYLLAILGVLFFFSIIAFIFSSHLHSILIEPYLKLSSQKLILQSVYGNIEVMLKLAFLCGFSISFPICLSIFWRFITPALENKTAYLGYIAVIFSSFLFWSGLFVAWAYIFPLALNFLFHDILLEGVSPQTTVEKYYSFLFLLHIGTGVVFQMPLLTIVLGYLDVLGIAWHKKRWRFVVIGSLFFSAFITPPDPLSQLALTALLLLLYFFSVFIVYLIEKSR